MTSHNPKNFVLESNKFKTPVRKANNNMHTPIQGLFKDLVTATPNDEEHSFKPYPCKSPIFGKQPIMGLNQLFQSDAVNSRGLISPMILPKTNRRKLKLDLSNINS